MRPRITVRRYEYEEPDVLHLVIGVSNGAFAGRTDIYCGRDELRTVGEALSGFPRSGSDAFQWEYGSEDPADRFYRYFLLKAFVSDKTRCALQVRINRNEDPPHDGVAQFSVLVDAAAINRLGWLFLKFHELRHLEFEWDDRDERLFERRRPGGPRED